MLRSVLNSLISRGESKQGGLAAAQAARAQGHVREAVELVSDFLRLHPDSLEGYVLRARLAKEERRFEAAIEDYERALCLCPEAIEVRIGLANVLHRVGRFEDALRATEQGLAWAPRHPMLHMNRGLMLRELGCFAEAEAALTEASALAPSHPIVRCHLASVLYDQGRVATAKQIVARVLEEEENNVEAHWLAALMALGEGDFEQGWRHYEHRLERHDAYLSSRFLERWSGPESKSVLILAEQGLGDEIMFASCFADIGRQVARLVIECDPRLGRLFARSFPNAEVLAVRDPAAGRAPTPADVASQLPAGSLPGIYRRRIADFPSHDGYLRASPERRDYWARRLAALGPGLKIGLSWRGGSLKTRQALRSLSMQELEPILALPGAHFVSLQYGQADPTLELRAARAANLIAHFPEAIADYDETASLVTALDLVITVTTAIVHLTGALGRPVWVLVPAVAEWRYRRSGETMPWYPSARLYRQQRLGDWAPVVQAVARDLQREIVQRRAADGTR